MYEFESFNFILGNWSAEELDLKERKEEKHIMYK